MTPSSRRPELLGAGHPAWQPGPPPPTSPSLPLRCCLLSGGASRRMGRDKALLAHPEGGTWLERTVLLLAGLGAPVTLLSRHPRHLELAGDLARRLGDPAAPDPQARIIALAEPPPWEGPLLALHRLMAQHPDERLLLCPVDMPQLTPGALHSLLAAAVSAPATAPETVPTLHLAHDGERLQPLLGLYPSSAPIRHHLAWAVAQGERRLQRWLAAHPCQAVPLDPRAIRNLNRPETSQPGESAGA
ncbi:MAG: molybdenum cofactor guanylyltransferase [Cyanobacteriota bacterium]